MRSIPRNELFVINIPGHYHTNDLEIAKKKRSSARKSLLLKRVELRELSKQCRERFVCRVPNYPEWLKSCHLYGVIFFDGHLNKLMPFKVTFYELLVCEYNRRLIFFLFLFFLSVV